MQTVNSRPFHLVSIVPLPCSPPDWLITLRGEGIAPARLYWSELDSALKDGGYAALNNLLLELWTSDIEPSFNTLAMVHSTVYARLAVR